MNTTATLIKHIIKSRKSIFPADYTETPIPEEIIEDILDIATYAPNHKKTKPWRLKAFRGEEKTALGAELQRLYKGHVPAEKFSEDTYNAVAQKVAKADTIISIAVEFSGKVPQWEEVAAVAMAVQNMYLLCTAYELGCYWGTPAFAPKLKDFLHLTENQECYGIFFIGNLQ